MQHLVDFLAWLIGVCQRHPRDSVAVGAFIALAAGFWLAWPPLGLIVPSVFVLGRLVWSQAAGRFAEQTPAPPHDRGPVG